MGMKRLRHRETSARGRDPLADASFPRVGCGRGNGLPARAPGARLIPAVRIPLTAAPRASAFRSDGVLAVGAGLLIRTDIRTGLVGTPSRTPRFVYGPSRNRSCVRLISNQEGRRADTCLRGVSRGDALAAVTMRPLATPHSGHASGHAVR